MSAEPAFHIWSAKEDSGPKGASGLREFYSGLSASGSNRFEYAVERIVIGDDTQVREGELYAPFSIEQLTAIGLKEFTIDKYYATQVRTVTFWPFERDTGQIIGEDICPLSTEITDAEEIVLNEYT